MTTTEPQREVVQIVLPIYAEEGGAARSLTSLSDVTISNPVAGNALVYNVTDVQWENRALVKADIGLSNVDNTSDAGKPVSAAQQAALNGKAATGHTHTTSQITDFNTATDARAQAKIDALIDAAPGALNTLNELATALGDDPNFAATITTALAGKQALHANLTGISGVGTVNEMIVFRYGGAWVRRTLAEFTAMLGITGGSNALEPLFNIESHGGVADGTTDNYAAFLATWNAMRTYARTASVYGPSIGTYRVALPPDRVQVWPDKQYAAFPIPMVTREAANLKQTFGIRGVGNAYTVRAAELAGEPAQVASATVFFFDYNPADFAWDATNGHPSIFGAPDADATDPVGNTFSNVGFQVRDVIFRSPDNPSLCVLNLEQVSTCLLDSVRFDVESVLDDLPEPTHPTGCAVLLPRSNNNVAIDVHRMIVEGYYGGIPLTEHLHLTTAIALACKIGAFTRRPCSHICVVSGQLKIEQCQWGFAGYSPDGVGPNLGVADFKGGIFRINAVDFEHYGYDGDPARAWRYTPGGYADVLDRNNTFTGTIAGMYVINSESPPIGTTNNATFYVRGNSGTNSPVAAYRIHDHTVAMTRVLGGVPSNPPVAPPNTPAIGTATAGITSAEVTFTPAGSGEPATSFTAIAYNGSNVAVGNATGSSSPIAITGLTAGIAVTIKVKANNIIGSSAESAASNAVTPTASGGLPADTFNGPDITTLGTSSSGHAWQGDPLGTWERKGNKAEANTTGTAWNPAWLPVSADNYRVSVETTHSAGEWGVCARVVDDQNFYYLDYQYDSSNTGIVTLFKRVGGSLSQLANETVSGLSEGVAMRLQLEVNGSTITGFANRAADPDNVISSPITDSTFTSGGGAGIVSLVVTTPHVTADNLTVTAV